MSRRILVQAGLFRARVALLQDDRLLELEVIDRGGGPVASAIHLGRVRQVAPALDGAFVELGDGSDGFLASRDAPGRRQRPLSARIHEGQKLLVQVRRQAGEDKGARLAARPQLAGRCLVFLPGAEEPQLAGGIAGKAARQRLQALLLGLTDEAGSFLARASSAGEDEAVLRDEAGRLRALWQTIADQAEQAKPPAALWQPDPLHRVLGEWLTPEVAELAASDPATLLRIRAFCEPYAPFALSRLTLHRGAQPLFDAEGVEEQLDEALSVRVELPSGGWLAIEPTTALTAIDVNAGAAATDGGRQTTALVTNLEAAKVIAAQLRLRGIGGLVVVDFLRMQGRGDARRLLDSFAWAGEDDPAEVRIAGMSELGLVEMTRGRRGLPLAEVLQQGCRSCEGTGRQAVPAMRAEAAMEQALALARGGPSARLELRAGTEVFGALTAIAGGEAALIELFRERCGCELTMVSAPELAEDAWEVGAG